MGKNFIVDGIRRRTLKCTKISIVVQVVLKAKKVKT